MWQLTRRACHFDFTSSARHVADVKNNIVDSLSRLEICEFHQLVAQERAPLHRGPIATDVMWNSAKQWNNYGSMLYLIKLKKLIMLVTAILSDYCYIITYEFMPICLPHISVNFFIYFATHSFRSRELQ